MDRACKQRESFKNNKNKSLFTSKKALEIFGKHHEEKSPKEFDTNKTN